MTKEISFSRFPNPRRPISPEDYYPLIYSAIESRNRLFKDYYITLAMTGPGVVTLDPVKTGSLSKEEQAQQFFKGNKIYSQVIKDFVVGELQQINCNPPIRLTMPYDIGSMIGRDNKPWNQYDYMFTWFCFIQGIKPQDACRFSQWLKRKGNIDRQIFGNFSAEKKRRIEEYRNFTEQFINFLQTDGDVRTNPVSGLLAIRGHHRSIGSNSEKALSMKTGIPVSDIALNINHPLFGAILQTLYESENKYGLLGKIYIDGVDASEHQGLVLVRPWSLESEPVPDSDMKMLLL